MKPVIIVVLLVVVSGGAYFIYQSIGQRSGSVAVPQAEVGQPAMNQRPNTVLESGIPTEKGNFSQTGNLSAQEDGWSLVWDEPGRMALNVKLKFTEQSSCILGGEKKDCGLLNKDEGSYYISVEGNRNEDEVTVIKLEEQQPPQ